MGDGCQVPVQAAAACAAGIEGRNRECGVGGCGISSCTHTPALPCPPPCALQNFVRTAANYGLLSAEELGRLDVVAINLEQPDTIPEAIGNAGRVSAFAHTSVDVPASKRGAHSSELDLLSLGAGAVPWAVPLWAAAGAGNAWREHCLSQKHSLAGFATWAPQLHALKRSPTLLRPWQVVCAVGAAESEVSDFSAPQRIDGEGTIALVEAATKAGVQQFVMVTSLGTGKIGFPAGGSAARHPEFFVSCQGHLILRQIWQFELAHVGCTCTPPA